MLGEGVAGGSTWGTPRTRTAPGKGLTHVHAHKKAHAHTWHLRAGTDSALRAVHSPTATPPPALSPHITFSPQILSPSPVAFQRTSPQRSPTSAARQTPCSPFSPSLSLALCLEAHDIAGEARGQAGCEDALPERLTYGWLAWGRARTACSRLSQCCRSSSTSSWSC